MKSYKYQCECKKTRNYMYEGDYAWNPSTCVCKCYKDWDPWILERLYMNEVSCWWSSTYTRLDYR